jgi:hypothetical protein
MAISCYADPNPPIKPAMRLIAAITKGMPTTITTTFEHGYATGTVVRLRIPEACVMRQLELFIGDITVTGPTTFTVNIDSTDFDTFTRVPVYPFPDWSDICAQVVPLGELNSMISQATNDVRS